MIGEMRRKGGWKATCGMGSRNRFENFPSVSTSARHARHGIVRNTGLFR